MTTVGTMASRISGHINRGSEYDAKIRQEIVSAVNFYKTKRFPWNTYRATTSTVANQEYYALPNDFLEADMMRILYSSGDFTDPLDEVTYRWIEDHRHNVNYRSEPEKFAVQGQDLRLWPVPDGAYTLTLTYLRDLGGFTASASDGVSNAWVQPFYGEELIRSRATAAIYANEIGGPEAKQEAAPWVARERELYRSLRNHAGRRESSGKLMPFI